MDAGSAQARTERVRERAFELGFDKVGFARATSADPDGHLAAWLKRGFGADMDYMERTANERANPRRLVEGAKSVIALAISYFWPSANPKGPLKVSRYALSDDYHRVVRKKVRQLRKLILTLDPDARVHPTVDTSPVLEREWAQRAGIGWVGKSTMAIAQDLGTYTFLSTLITTTELVYDESHVDRCGSCTKCIDACPTEAFVGPYQLDSRKCISYWTVEQRNAFDETTPPLHGWVGGCDICQEVCPWNKFAKPTSEDRFTPRPGLVEPNVKTFSDPSRNDELGALIQGTALQRTGAAALRRNALETLTRH